MANIGAYSDYSLSHELRTRLFPFTFHYQKSSLASKPSTSWPRPILSATVNPYGVFIYNLQNPPLLHHLAQCSSPHNCVWSGEDGVDNKNSHAIGLRDGASDAKSTRQISTHVRISNFRSSATALINGSCYLSPDLSPIVVACHLFQMACSELGGVNGHTLSPRRPIQMSGQRFNRPQN